MSWSADFCLCLFFLFLLVDLEGSPWVWLVPGELCREICREGISSAASSSSSVAVVVAVVSSSEVSGLQWWWWQHKAEEVAEHC